MTMTRVPQKCGCKIHAEEDKLLEQQQANNRALFEVWLREVYLPRKTAEASANAAEVDAAVAVVEHIINNRQPV